MNLRSVTEALTGLMAIATFTFTFGGAIWFFVDDEVVSKINHITGVTSHRELILERFEQQAATDDELLNRITQVEERLNNANFSTRMFKIDEVRSLVWEDCPTDGACQYTLRVKRTPLGRTCGQPEVVRYVTDRFGITHPVEGVKESQSILRDGRWTDVTNSFILPDTIPPGVAEFFLELTYLGCFPDEPAIKVRETTEALTFKIKG